MTNVFVKGTLVATDGTMQTTSDTPDGNAVRVAGIAHKPTGERYVTGWPDDGVVHYVNGAAITPSGQQVVLADTTPAIFRNGLGYSLRGELAAKTSGTPAGAGGFGVTADGYSIMTDTGFSPKNLFAAGEVGVWYDPSDLTTMFQDIEGVTPVTAVEQVVGLMLDKSRAIPLGNELITNGDFSGGTTGWTATNNSTLSVVAGRIRVAIDGSTAYGSAVQSITTVVGKRYRVAAQGFKGTDNSFWIVKSDSPTNFAVQRVDFVANSNVDKTVYYGIFTATATTTYIWLINNTGTAGQYSEFDNISVKEIYGNHARAAANDTTRPTLRARYSLLTYSEQFDNAIWTRSNNLAFGSGSVANTPATTDPLGGNTADLLVFQNGAAAASGVSISTTPGATTITASIYAKTAGVRYIQALDSNGSSTGYVNFDLVGGSITASSGYTGTMTDVGNGWFRLTATQTYTGASGIQRWYAIDSPTATRGGTFTGDGVKGVYLWGADFRTGSSPGTYQRIAAATDYDSDPTKFPPYLAFDGSNDALSTAAIDFSATDKMSVFAGVTKLTETAGLVAELTNSSVNVGSFYLAAPVNSLTPTFAAAARGAVNGQYVEISSYPAPSTAVLTALMDIGAPYVSLEANSSGFSSNTGAMGATMFANSNLYVGARNNGASFKFTGNLYSLIVRGAASDAATITKAEKWVAKKTGVTL